MADWVLVLGVSSGFGAATALAFARAGFDVLGVHLDRRATMHRVEALEQEITGMGRKAVFYNRNAADDTARQEMVADMASQLEKEGGTIKVMLHSLAFGTLVEYVPKDDDQRAVTRRQLEMSVDVMANSFIYWSQDVIRGGLMTRGGRLFAMTSSGSTVAIKSYGPVSAAKAALESHVRQLAMELAPRGITSNAILAGVTHTPALDKIPGNELLMKKALMKNPHDRLTVPDDVGPALVALSVPELYWMTGNTIRIDGGEDGCG